MNVSALKQLTAGQRKPLDVAQLDVSTGEFDPPAIDVAIASCQQLLRNQVLAYGPMLKPSAEAWRALSTLPELAPPYLPPLLKVEAAAGPEASPGAPKSVSARCRAVFASCSRRLGDKVAEDLAGRAATAIVAAVLAVVAERLT